MESTLVIIKPNGLSRGLAGEVIRRYEMARLSLGAVKIMRPSRERVEGFYMEHRGKEFYPPLIDFMISGPILVMVVMGRNAIEAVRSINGNTNPAMAVPGTIRFDFALSTRKNIVHASDSPESAEREIQYWFGSDTLVQYNLEPGSEAV